MDMLQPEWSWSATGDLTINGTNLVAQGTPGDPISGDLS